MSASAPAGRPSSSNGSRLAVWMSATSVGDVVRSPISHAAATVWKNVPMFEPSWAANRAAKTLWRSGAHGDIRAASGAAPVSVIAAIVARATDALRSDRRAIVTARRCGSRPRVPMTGHAL